MRRALIAALSTLLVLGGALALLLRDEDRAPLPSRDELSRNGFAVWPEDTLAEGMDACEEAEAWRLDSAETALRFAHDVLRFSEPRVSLEIDDWGPRTIRHFIDASDGELPMLIDVREYGRCWFVVGATPREGGFSTTLAFIHRSGDTDLAIKTTGERAEVGYGSWHETIAGNDQVVLDLPRLGSDATGHVISLGCWKHCDASAWTLGFVPQPATSDVDPIPPEETLELKGVCRTGGFGTQLRALANLYAMTVKKPIGTRYGKPSVGKVRLERIEELPRLGIEPLGNHRWSFAVDGVALEAHVAPVGDRCWTISSIDHPGKDLLRSLHVGDHSLTFDIRWGDATAATVGLSSARGGDSWELEQVDGLITVTGTFPQPREEPFVVEVSLRDGRTLVSHQKSWYRIR